MCGTELRLVGAAGELIRRVRRALAPAILLPLAGCYTYRPLPDPLPAAGTRVAVTLTDAGSDTLAARIGPRVERVSGDVLRADTAGLTLAVREVEDVRGIGQDWQGEPVVVPRRFVRDIEQRNMSVGGTGLLGGAIAAGLVAATVAIGGAGDVEGGDGGPAGSGQ
jgi:hypothetical protein